MALIQTKKLIVEKTRRSKHTVPKWRNKCERQNLLGLLYLLRTEAACTRNFNRRKEYREKCGTLFCCNRYLGELSNELDQNTIELSLASLTPRGRAPPRILPRKFSGTLCISDRGAFPPGSGCTKSPPSDSARRFYSRGA